MTVHIQQLCIPGLVTFRLHFRTRDAEGVRRWQQFMADAQSLDEWRVRGWGRIFLSCVEGQTEALVLCCEQSARVSLWQLATA